ncbi:MAG: hypothetical protein WBC91_11950 [Phototrophicaceae bacterium]
MPNGTQDKPDTTGESDKVDNEPRLDRESKRPLTLPEIEIIKQIGSTTGVMRIRREGKDETSQGDNDNPL